MIATPTPIPAASPSPTPSPALTPTPTPTAVATDGPAVVAVGAGPTDHGSTPGPTDGLGAFIAVTRQAVEGVVSEIATQVGATVKPAAVAAVATSFGFPIALMIAVLLFLLIQDRLDGRDPKLRAAPLTADETLIVFTDGGDA